MDDEDGRGDDAYPEMTSAELRVTLHTLGLTRDQVSRLLRVSARTVDRWQYGERLPPPGVVGAIRAWQERADAELAEMLAAVDADPSQPVVTFRDNEAWLASRPGERMPAAWHRAVVARVLASRPGVRVVYER